MKLNVKLLIGADSFFTLVGGMLGPLYAVYVEEIGGDILTATAAVAVFSFVLGVMLYFLGKYGDKIKNDKALIVAGYAIKSIGFLGYYFVSSVLHLFIVEIILAVGYATVYPAYNSLYSKSLEEGKTCSTWGTYESITQIFYAIGAIASGALVTVYGFKTLFLLMFVLSLIGLLVALRLVVESPKQALSLVADKCAKMKIFLQMFF